MDFVKNALGGNNTAQPAAADPEEAKKGGFNFGDAINGALGGGKQSEANEGELAYSARWVYWESLSSTPMVTFADYLDKA